MNNELKQIQAGLIAYIGAIQEVISVNGNKKNQIIAGILTDEILKIAQTDMNKPCDLYILIPIFKANIIILKQQMKLLSLQEITSDTKEKLLNYQAVIEFFQKLINENNKKE